MANKQSVIKKRPLELEQEPIEARTDERQLMPWEMDWGAKQDRLPAGPTAVAQQDTSIKGIKREVPNGVRVEIGGLEKPEDKLRALQRRYPDAQAVGDDNFVMTDPETGERMVYNIPGWIPSWGDFGEALPDIVGGVASIPGAVGGALIGGGTGSVVPIVGTTTGALAGGATGGGLGFAAGRNLTQSALNWYHGNDDTRTLGEYAADVGTDAAIGATAELGGAIAMPLIGSGLRATGRGVGNLFRKATVGSADDAAKAATTLDNFRAIGVEPTPGMINPTAKTAGREQALRPLSETIDRRINEAFEGTANAYEDVITNMSGGVGTRTKQEVGEMLQDHTQAYRNMRVDRTNQLYDNVGALTQNTPAAGRNTTKLLETLNADKKALTKSQALNQKSAYDSAIKQTKAIADDIKGGASFDQLKEARTAVGQIAFNRTADPAEQATMRRLYDSLTKDMGETAETAGEAALEAWRKANNFAARSKGKGSMSLGVADDLLKKDTPEAVYNYAVSGLKNGGTRIGQILRQVRAASGEDAANEITAGVVGRMGRTINAEGIETFNPTRFVKQWDDLSLEAKNAMFSSKAGRSYRENLERIAVASRSLREHAGKANHSNSTSHQTLLGGLNPLRSTVSGGSAVASVATGNPAFLLAPLFAAGGRFANRKYMEKMFTSPQTVAWLANVKSAPISKGGVTGYLDKLRRIGSETKDQALNAAIRDYLYDIEAEQGE